jgi:hypothetical protein
MMAHELIQLFERAFIQEEIDSFARGEFSGFVFAFASLRPAAGFGFFAAAAQFLNTALLGACGSDRR